MSLSPRQRQELDFAPPEYREHVWLALSQMAPIERKLRRYDWVVSSFGLIAVGAGVFAAFGGLGVWGWLLAATNALFFSLQWERRRARREMYAWLCDAGEYFSNQSPDSGHDAG